MQMLLCSGCAGSLFPPGSKTTHRHEILPRVQDEVVLPHMLSGTISMIKGRQAWSPPPQSLPSIQKHDSQDRGLELAKDFHIHGYYSLAPSQPPGEGVLIRALTTGMLMLREEWPAQRHPASQWPRLYLKPRLPSSRAHTLSAHTYSVAAFVFVTHLTVPEEILPRFPHPSHPVSC